MLSIKFITLIQKTRTARPNGNSLQVNTTTGRVVSTTGNRVNYHGKLTVLQFMMLQRQLLTL